MQEVAEARGKTVPQVDSVFLTLHVMITIDTLRLSSFCWHSFQGGTSTLVLVVIQIPYVQAGGTGISANGSVVCVGVATASQTSGEAIQ